MADTLIPGLNLTENPELGDTMFESLQPGNRALCEACRGELSFDDDSPTAVFHDGLERTWVFEDERKTSPRILAPLL